MAKHNNTTLYPFDNNVTINDGLLGFDAENVRRTRNFKVSSLVSLVLEQVGGAIRNALVTGSAIWIEDMTYKFWDIGYWLNSQYIEIDSQEVILSAADPTNPRIDAIYANSDGQLVVIEGDPAPNPLRPLINSTTQVLVTFILIDAGGSVPSGVSEDIVYSDNLVTDWTNSTSGFVSVDFDSLTNPFEGTKCIAVKEAAGTASYLRFYKGATAETYEPSLKLHLYIKVDALVDNSTRIDIQLFNDNVPEESDFATLGNGSYGFDINNMDDYQSVIIPFSDMSGINEYNGINILIGEAALAAFKFDDIRIVAGVDDLILNNTFLNLLDTTDDTYVGKEGYFPKVVNGQLKLVPVAYPNITTINGNTFNLVKHPDNNTAGNESTLEVNDFVINGFWDNTEFWVRAQYSGGDVTDQNNWRAIRRVEQLSTL